MKWFKIRLVLFQIGAIRNAIVLVAYISGLLVSPYEHKALVIAFNIFSIAFLAIRILQCLKWREYYWLIYVVLIINCLSNISGNFMDIALILICTVELYYFYKRRNRISEIKEGNGLLLDIFNSNN